MSFRKLCSRKREALNYIAVSVVTVFPLLPCPIVATDQPMRQTSCLKQVFRQAPPTRIADPDNRGGDGSIT